MNSTPSEQHSTYLSGRPTATQVIGVRVYIVVRLWLYIAVGLRLGKRQAYRLMNVMFIRQEVRHLRLPPYRDFHSKYPSKLQTTYVSVTKDSAILQPSFSEVS